jgi:DNA-binding beta-propeller fold protein YncE
LSTGTPHTAPVLHAQSEPALTMVPTATPEARAASASMRAPRFEVDPWWPKPLPEGWITGQLAGVCVDRDDNVIVVNRGDITKEEQETCIRAPAVIIFNPAGEVIDAWGDWEVLPTTPHSCCVDNENNIWISTNGDGMVQKYTHDGRLLLQIGDKGVFDSEDGTKNSAPLNAARNRLFKPAGIAVDPETNDVYFADGYGNRRVVVFDSNGNYLRQWGRQATPEEMEAGVGGAFAQVVHDVKISSAGLVYVCDRQGDRVQVFDKLGNFKRNIWIRTGTPTLPDKRGTAWWVDFSRDPEQKFLFVMNGRNEQVHILDHARGEILASFGRPGHQLGNFTHGHSLALDSRGNLYVAETNWGRRIQKFKPVN